MKTVSAVPLRGDTESGLLDFSFAFFGVGAFFVFMSIRVCNRNAGRKAHRHVRSGCRTRPDVTVRCSPKCRSGCRLWPFCICDFFVNFWELKKKIRGVLLKKGLQIGLYFDMWL